MLFLAIDFNSHTVDGPGRIAKHDRHLHSCFRSRVNDDLCRSLIRILRLLTDGQFFLLPVQYGSNEQVDIKSVLIGCFVVNSFTVFGMVLVSGTYATGVVAERIMELFATSGMESMIIRDATCFRVL